MTLTPEQKIEAYTYAMLAIVSEENYGVCPALWDWGCENKVFPNDYRSYPEFEKQKPKNTRPHYYWWRYGAVHPRLLALERAIEMVKNLNEIR